MFRPRTIAMGVLAAALAFFATSTAASAHDSLISSSPEEGQRLEAAPAEVSLRFTADVLPIGAAVIVSDAADRDWVSGEVVLVGDTVTAPLEAGMPDAGYELRWRVVSSDGHPISGLIPFTVGDGDGEPIVRSDRGNADGSGTAANPDDAQGQITDEGSEEPGGIPRVVWLGIGGAVVALAIAALIAFIRRRTRAGEAGDAGPDADAAPEPSTAAHPQHSRDDASSGQHSL
ncbi:MAG: copper resistance protein CopC [Microbacteriaceae bacterium]